MFIEMTAVSCLVGFSHWDNQGQEKQMNEVRAHESISQEKCLHSKRGQLYRSKIVQMMPKCDNKVKMFQS